MDKIEYEISFFIKRNTGMNKLEEELKDHFSSFNLDKDYQRLVIKDMFLFLSKWVITGITKSGKFGQFKKAILSLPDIALNHDITYYKTESIILYKGKKYNDKNSSKN